MTTTLQNLHQIIKNMEFKKAFAFCKVQGLNIDFCIVSKLRFEIIILLFEILGFNSTTTHLSIHPLYHLKSNVEHAIILPLKVYQNSAFIIITTPDADSIHIALNYNNLVANYWSFPLKKTYINSNELYILRDMFVSTWYPIEIIISSFYPRDDGRMIDTYIYHQDIHR